MTVLAVDWTTVLLEGAASLIAAVVVIVSVIVGARIYREGSHDHRPDVRDRDDTPDP